MASRNDSRGANGERTTGQIARIIPDKGFGFIAGSQGREYFFHMSNCEPGLWEKLVELDENNRGAKGRVVSFEPAKTEKGPRALQVQE